MKYKFVYNVKKRGQIFNSNFLSIYFLVSKQAWYQVILVLIIQYSTLKFIIFLLYNVFIRVELKN